VVDTCISNIFTDIRDKALLLFLLDSGVRAQELINLNIQDINQGQVKLLFCKVGVENQEWYLSVNLAGKHSANI
jgi:site-specific recombinase XerD